MPQHSETQSKPSYFRGHYWGVVGVLVGSFAEAFCLPLEARLHQGFAHLDPHELSPTDRDTQGGRLVHMALDFVKRTGIESILVLDAFFSIAAVFEVANSLWSIALKQPALIILTRAKKSYVAYLALPAPTTPVRGRPRKYGDKVKLKAVFETYQAQFLSAPCHVYGKEEIVSYLALNLLWKPIKRHLRFIFVVTSRGPLVLMCNDLSMEPLMAISLYCARVRVETMFTMLKGLLGAFAYRFWSKYLPRHSRKPTKNAALKPPQTRYLAEVHHTWQACEGFVMLGCIALGLLQMIALKFPGHIWAAFTRFLRTRRRTLPSERTVKDVLAQELMLDFHNLQPSAMMQAIHRLGQSSDEDDDARDEPPRQKPQAA